MDLGLHGKRAIVCASSRGLGRACALSLAEAGVEVTVNGRDPRETERTAADIQTRTGSATNWVAADISRPEGRTALLAGCADPDILVTNIGGPRLGDFREWDEAAWCEAINNHMIAPIMLIRAVVDGMVARGFGRIVNITSRAVRQPMPMNGLSNGARAGLTAFVAGLARQLARHDVTINNLLPGPFATERQQESLRLIAARRGETVEHVQAERLAEVPAGRFGRVEEIGKLCAFVCGRDAGFIVGQNILIDGGAVNLV